MTTSSLPRRGIVRLLTPDEREHGSAQFVATGRMVDEGETEASRRGARPRDEIGVGRLREQHDPAVRTEVGVAKLGMAVETEPAPDEGVEVLGEEVGEVEGAELFVVQRSNRSEPANTS